MEKTTNLKLSKRLANYGALAATIIGAVDASGQSIIYTDITDFSGGVGSTFQLDLDGNGTDDFRINNVASSSVNNLFIEPLTASNDVLGTNGGSNFAYPYALSSGDDISPTATGSWNNQGFTSSSYASLNYGACSFGNWCNVTDRFLGLRFNIGGNIHYGWARLDVSQDGSIWAVKDFAYHDTAGVGLMAGQQTLSVDTNQLKEARVVVSNNNINLFNLPETANYKLYDLSGKQVLDGETLGDTFVVDASALSSGMYIMELLSNDSKAVIREKIIF